MVLTSTGPRVAIWPAIIFLLWNCMGLAAFTMQSMADLTELAKTDAYQAKIWSDMPGWAWGAYGVAVGAGLAGAIALLVRLRVAVWLSAICVIAVIIQFGWTFLGTDILAVKGASTALFPLFILVMAVVQFLYAKSLSGKGALR